jgi:hypothetical protein
VVRISIPTTMQRFAAAFIHDTKFDMITSNNLDDLKKIFPFGDPPYGVVLDNGREQGVVAHYDDNEPAESLRKLGMID